MIYGPCLTEQQVVDYTKGISSADIEIHLLNCPLCRDWVDGALMYEDYEQEMRVFGIKVDAWINKMKWQRGRSQQ